MRFLHIRRASYLCCLVAMGSPPVDAETAYPSVQLRVEEVHPWRPPFRLERVGQSRAVAIESPQSLPRGELTVAARSAGREVARQKVSLPDKPPRVARVWFAGLLDFDELTLTLKVPDNATPVELARQKMSLPIFEADAIALPEQKINPVDLNAILVPGDWLLLGPGQSGRVTITAIQRGDDDKKLTARAWFESKADKTTSIELTLHRAARNETTLPLPTTVADERDVLHVSIVDAGGREIWHKQIITMRVAKPLGLPRFGAVATRRQRSLSCFRYQARMSRRSVIARNPSRLIQQGRRCPYYGWAAMIG
jgi:hypothetical protein